MIIDFNRYNGGGGSGSGVTPQDVQRQINNALVPYWDSGETVDYVDEALSGISLDGYYTSAQTEEAIAEALSGFTPAGDSTVLKGVFDYPAEPELGDMVSKLETMPTFWWYDGDNTTLKMHIEPLILDTGETYNVISFETQADGVLYGRILYDDHNQVMTLKFFDEEDNEVYLLGNLNKVRYLDIAIGDGYYVGIGFLDDDFTSEGGRMLQVGRTDGTFGNWQGNTGQIPELEVEDIEVEDERTGEMIPGIPAAIGPWFYNGGGWIGVDQYVTGPIWKTINTINSDIDTLNDRVDELSGSTPDLSAFWNSAQTEEAITSKNYVNSGQVKSQVEAYNYVTSAETKAYVDSAVTVVQDQIDTLDEVVSAALVDLNDRVDEKVESEDIKHIVKLTQAEYDQLATKDPETFYIIINNSN